MATSSDSPQAGPPSQGAQPPAAPQPERKRERGVHEVVFVTYPKLLFIWPLILAGFALWPLGRPVRPEALTTQPAGKMPAPPAQAAPEPAAGEAGAQTSNPKPQTAPPPPAAAQAAPAPVSRRLEILGWVYIWVFVLVLMTLGVDVDRNQAAFWVILVAALWILGVWLRDFKQFTLFGELYRWFANLDVQYNRSLGLVVSVIMLLPYVIMILWGRLNDRWRITHNEFEHYSFGRLDDSLGRGAKTIRTNYPDMFELLLGLAGTLIVFNAIGTKELRRIPHVMFLPFVRKRLNRILEATAITAAQAEDEEDEENP